MALARILSLTRRPAYQPSPRVGHYAAPIGGKVVMWGGFTEDFLRMHSRPTQSVEVLDTVVEEWQYEPTTGEAPPPMYKGACATVGDTLYICCGYDGTTYLNSIHALDSGHQWRTILPTNPDKSPMAKIGCAMIPIDNDKFALVGGYGVPTHPVQQGATFTRTGYTDGSGWTNEFHIFHTKGSEWSSPIMTGDRPPPCAHFTFTAIDNNRAVFFAGIQPEGRMNDAFILDHRLMHWTKLKRVRGPWPKGRSSHAACCINYGSENPLLLVIGGVDGVGNPLKDAWLLNANTGLWKEVKLPDELQPRWGHTLTAVSLVPGLTEVTMFGGSWKWNPINLFNEKQSKLADTVLLRLESVPSSGAGLSPRDWVLTSVTAMDQLGQSVSLREKLHKMDKHGAFPGAGRETRPSSEETCPLHQRILVLEESAREAVRGREEEMRDAQRRVGEADQRALDLQIQLTRSEETREEAERRVQGLQTRLAETERGRTEAEEGREAADHRAGEAEARTAMAEEEMRELETRFTHSEEGRVEAEQIAREAVQRAEERACEAERGRRETEGGREEAERGREEAERRLRQAENEQAQAEQERREAEQQRREAERGRREAEERAEVLRRQGEEEPSWMVRREEIQLTTEELGRGGWAVVKVANFRGLRVAAKCLHQQIISDYNRHLFTREMNLAARIRHPNLLLFVGATVRGELIILTELMPTSLRAILERGGLTPPQCLSVSLDIATALNYLHLMRPNPILHRDISSANVLLEPGPHDSWRAKVSDYGSANFLQQLRTENPGAAVYAAPEASDPARQSTKMDIFSFGILLVEVYTRRFPNPSDRERLIQSIRDGRVVMLIRQCTSEDKTRRPTASVVITQLHQL